MTTETTAEQHLLETIHNNTRTITTVEELENAHSGYFFTDDSMRYFASIIEPGVWGGCVFITSERDKTGRAWEGRRRWTVRAIDEHGQIISGEHGQFASRKAAANYARKITGGAR